MSHAESMDEPIFARFAWDAEAMTEAMAAHRRQTVRRSLRIVLTALLYLYVIGSTGALLVIILHPRSTIETRNQTTILLVMMLAFWAWLIYAARNNSILRWKARRVFRSNPQTTTFVDWTIGPDHLILRTATAESTVLWPLFMKVVEDPAGFLLYQNLQHYQWLPGRAFASKEALRQFADLARTKVPQYVVLGECRFPAKPEPTGLDEL